MQTYIIKYIFTCLIVKIIRDKSIIKILLFFLVESKGTKCQIGEIVVKYTNTDHRYHDCKVILSSSKVDSK